MELKLAFLELQFRGKSSKIIFTASVEDTTNAYDDGEILGSFIGIIDIGNDTISREFEYCAIPNIDEIFKVESVTVVQESTRDQTKLILITDDDLGNSVLIESRIKW